MNDIFNALSSVVRRKILVYLSSGEMTVSQLTSKFDMSQPSISKHLSILENANLITKNKNKNFVYYQLAESSKVMEAFDFITKFCPVSNKIRKEMDI